MKSASGSNKPGHVTKVDVFDDMGASAEDTLEAKIKAEIWQALIKHIERRGISQAQLAEELQAHQPDVSYLLKGKISKFSITKLIQFAGRLDLDARIAVKSRRARRTTVPATSLSKMRGRGGREAVIF